MIERYFPGRPVEVIAHGTALAAPTSSGVASKPSPHPFDLPDDGLPTVAVLGAIGPDKGSRRLERMVERVRRDGLRLRFVLIGYHDAENGPWQSSDATFTIHGRYEPSELPGLLAHYRVKLVAFPSTGPESFSLTLSEAWAAGLPAIVPPIGALAERMRAQGAGWSWTEAEWRSDDAMLARIAELVDPVASDALAAAGRRARDVVQQPIAEMTRRTLARYDACAITIPEGPAFAPERVRDALGYVRWSLSDGCQSVREGSASSGSEAAPAQSPLHSGLRRAARGLRRSFAGRAFARLAPARIRNVLKRRLP